MRSAHLANFYALLHRYYAHELTRIHPSEWHAFEAFKNDAAASPDIQAAVMRIAHAPAADIEAFEYDFNRLFVGPEKLLAAPYETVYLSNERVLMRQATLSVRQAYQEAGMQVDAKNVEPDDHFAYEFAFMAQLAGKEDKAAQEMLESFVRDHMNRWVPGHVEAIRQNTSNQVCLGFADLLEAVNSRSYS